jgi:hypothetical protein
MAEKEPWIEKLIREGIERGELDPHEGVGEPIPDVDRPYDADWWAKAWIERSKKRTRRHLTAEDMGSPPEHGESRD